MEGNRVYNCIKGHSFLYPQPKAISIESRGRAIHITRCRPPLASTARCPFDDGYLQRSAPSPPSPPPKTSSPPGFPAVAAFRPSSDGYGFSSAMSETDETVHRVEEKGRLLHPDPDQMQREEGLILREWRRRGAFLQDPIIRRFAKMLSSLRRRGRKRNVEIKLLLKLNNTSKLFYEKGKLNCETNKLQTREREKLYLSNREKFHSNADKQYWKAIAKDVAAAVEISATEGQAAKPEVAATA